MVTESAFVESFRVLLRGVVTTVWVRQLINCIKEDFHNKVYQDRSEHGSELLKRWLESHYGIKVSYVPLNAYL